MNKKDRLNAYLATILLPSLLVDEVKNVVSLEQEDIRKLNQSILEARDNLLTSMVEEYHKMVFDINITIFERETFLNKIYNIESAPKDFEKFIDNKNWNWRYLYCLNYYNFVAILEYCFLDIMLFK